MKFFLSRKNLSSRISYRFRIFTKIFPPLTGGFNLSEDEVSWGKKWKADWMIVPQEKWFTGSD